MSDSETDPLSSLLSSFALGPAWARASGDKPARVSKAAQGGEDRPPRRDDRDRGPRPDGDRRPFKGGRQDSYNDRRNSPPPPREDALPAEGVRTTIAPDAQAVHLIGKEVHQVARVYALFDVAKILLAEKSRCRAIFEAPEPAAPLFRGKLDESVFLTREEALAHFWNTELRQQFIEEEVVEVEPPTGNFQAIARCGISGEWLGPVNFHSYQTNLRRLHRERFQRMPFELYASKVRTERGEEAVNAWLETMKRKTRWRIKGDADDAWIDDRAEAERAVAARHFDTAFESSRTVDVSGAIPAKNLSPALLTSLRIAGTHARNHPAILIPAVCRAIEAEHLPVFKRQGKLHTGPARPHPLALDAVLAERPGKMVAWIRENTPAKLEGLWKAVLPEGSTAPPAEYAADLFWLLQQGHILLYTNDTLVVQDAREAVAPNPDAPAKKKKKKKSKKAREGADPEAGATESAPVEGTTESAPVEGAAEVASVDEITPDKSPQESTTAPDTTEESTVFQEPVESASEAPASEADSEPAEPSGLAETPASAVESAVAAPASPPVETAEEPTIAVADEPVETAGEAITKTDSNA